MSQTILLEHHSDGVTVLTFNRPQALNALDVASMRLFAQAIDEMRQRPTCRVLIVTGAGQEAFCSGGDLSELRNQTRAEDARAMITLMGDALLALERLPFPTIAAINGFALGGGSEIALACDLRLVDQAARLGFVQINMALTPGWGAGQRLLRLVGYARAMEILLAGAAMNADQIRQVGLAHHIVPQGQALKSAREWAASIAKRPPDVVRGIKTLLQGGLNHDYETALMIERDLFPPLWEAEAHLQAVERFFQRRKRLNMPED